MNASVAVLALAIAASGYVIATRCYLFKYEVARQAGHRLYLTTITLGFLAMLAGKAILYFFTISNNALAAFIVIISFIGAELYNRKIPFAKQKAMARAWAKDDLEGLVAHCVFNFRPLMLTLDSRKTYVGVVKRTIEPGENGGSHISLFPIYSGFRRESDLHLTLTHRYDAIINFLLDDDKNGSADDYSIIIPIKNIQSASVFNEDIYRAIDGDHKDILVTSRS